MKIMLSVLNVERPLQTMQMAFGYVPMSVTTGLTPSVQLHPVQTLYLITTLWELHSVMTTVLSFQTSSCSLISWVFEFNMLCWACYVSMHCSFHGCLIMHVVSHTVT